MKKALAILLVAGTMVGGLASTADAGGNWSISATWVSGYPVVRPAPCPPVVVAPAPVVYTPPVVYTRPVVYPTTVVYPRPVVYSTPVVYTRPAVTFGFTYGGYRRPHHRSYTYRSCGTRYYRPPVHCSSYGRGGHSRSGHHRR